MNLPQPPEGMLPLYLDEDNDLCLSNGDVLIHDAKHYEDTITYTFIAMNNFDRALDLLFQVNLGTHPLQEEINKFFKEISK